VCLEDIAERLVVLLEGGKNSRVKMLRHGAAIALRNDVHGFQMVEGGLVGSLAGRAS